MLDELKGTDFIDSDLIVLNEEIADAKEKEKLWTTFVDMEMVVKGIPKLISFCFDYMPSSVEITKPEEFVLKKSTIENSNTFIICYACAYYII